MSLCFRCQRRVESLEGSDPTTPECGDFRNSRYICHIFIPTKLAIITTPRLSLQQRFAGEVTEKEFALVLKVSDKNEKHIPYWRPVGITKALKESIEKGGNKNDYL